MLKTQIKHNFFDEIGLCFQNMLITLGYLSLVDLFEGAYVISQGKR